MAILREKEVRRRERSKRKRAAINELTPEESANVVAALKVLAVRYRDLAVVAREMGLREQLPTASRPLQGDPSATPG